MKNKELALKISKHPLMKKVAKLEDKRVIARLVIEELLREEPQENVTKIKEYMKENDLLFQIQSKTYGPDKVFALPNSLNAYIADKELNQKELQDAKNYIKMIVDLAFLKNILEYTEQFEERAKEKIKIDDNTFQAMKLKPSDVGELGKVISNARNSAFLLKKVKPGEEADDQSGDSDADSETIDTVVKSVDDSLKDFLNFLKNKITGGFEESEPEEEGETLQEGILDNIKKALARRGKPEKVKGTFIKLLSKYLEGSEIEINEKELNSYWDEWSETNEEEAEDIIAAYTYHLLKFKKPELLGTTIRKLAGDIVVGGKSKLDQFIEKVVNQVVQIFINKENFEEFNFENDNKDMYEKAIKKVLSTILPGREEAIEKLMSNNKFTVPAFDQLEEKLKEEWNKRFKFDEKVFQQIADFINNEDLDLGDGDIGAIRKLLSELLESDVIEDFKSGEKEVKRHIEYLVKEKSEKKLKEFIYEKIEWKQTKKDLRKLVQDLKRLAQALKKQIEETENENEPDESGNINESVLNVKKIFNREFEDLENYDDNPGLRIFFMYKNNVEFFKKYFFGDKLKEPTEQDDEESKAVYSFLVLRALDNQSKTKESELVSYFSAIKEKISDLKDEKKEPQVKKYENLKNELVFLLRMLQKYKKIINDYMKEARSQSKNNSPDARKDRSITANILPHFDKNFPDYDLIPLYRWIDDPENKIQFPDKTSEPSATYLEKLQFWDDMKPDTSEKSAGPKAKAFLYDYRILVRDKGDGKIKRFIDRMNQIDDEIRTGKEQDPKDEKADSAIPKERYEYFLQEAKPIAKFLQETPITFIDDEMNFGSITMLPEFNTDRGEFKNLVIDLNRNEFTKSKLFKFIQSPKDQDTAKQNIEATIKSLQDIQQAKKDGLADNEQTYDIFLKEVDENLTYFKMGWPLFSIKKGKIELNTPYRDNTKFEDVLNKSNLKDELIRMSNKSGRQTKEAIKSKYSGNKDEQQELTDNLNELTKLRNKEIKSDCLNIWTTHKMNEDDHREYRKSPEFKNRPEKRYEKPQWDKVKKLIEDVIAPFWNSHTNSGITDIENKEAYKKFLDAYKQIVQIAKDQNKAKDVTGNKNPRDGNEFELQERIVKLIKPILIKKLKRKQNG